VSVVVLASGCADDGVGTGSAEDLTVVTLNVLHGLPLPGGCGEDTDFCRAPDRLDLLWSAIEQQAGCPDVVALQEIGPRQKELIPDRLGDLCTGSYELLFSEQQIPDQEMILTTLPVVEDHFLDLSGGPWTAHVARLDSDLGPVDVLATHFASSAFNPDCGSAENAACDPACPAGIEMGSCNAIEAVAELDRAAADADLQLLVGDLNREIDDPRLALVTEAGFEDTWLLAGNPECGTTGEASPASCTSGVSGDSELDGLDRAEQDLDRRIDFVLARPADGCALTVDTADDGDGDGTPTALFAVGPLDPPVDGLVWFSDHQGVMADIGLECG
jgi:endonuclease/exonuclease/phosphatase family metal-dependent hydrolase